MRRIDALRTLALSSALILALGGTGCGSEEDTSDAGEPPSVEAVPPAEEEEEEADETSPPAETPDTEASEAEEEQLAGVNLVRRALEGPLRFIAEKPEKQKGGGAPGMGGMDDMM